MSLDTGVLCRQRLVHLIQRINLKNVTSQYGAHRCQLLFQTRNFACIAAFGFSQLLQQALGLLLFLRQLGDNRVVVNLALHLAILIGKLLILVFHFLFIQGSKLFHVLGRLLLLPEVEIKVCNAACQQED